LIFSDRLPNGKNRVNLQQTGCKIKNIQAEKTRKIRLISPSRRALSFRPGEGTGAVRGSELGISGIIRKFPLSFIIKMPEMKKYLLLLVVFFSLAVYAADKGTWTGYISDSHCGADGAKEGHVACAKKCIKEGSLPVFVLDGKVYTISDPKKVSKYLGQKVTITGTMTGDAIDVEKVAK
jgi:hypothetical protein